MNWSVTLIKSGGGWVTAPVTTADRLTARGVGVFDDLATEWPGWEGAEPTDSAQAEPTDSDAAEPTDCGPTEPADCSPAEPTETEPAEPADRDRAEPARPRGDGGWFAVGGVADGLRPGPALAGFAADAWSIGLGRLTDDELIGVMRAARRLASWAAAMELAAAGDLWRRRCAEEQAGDTGAARHADDEIAAALTLTARGADQVLGLAVALRRLPLTSRALTVGDIDLPRAMVIADEATGLDTEHAAAVEQGIIGAAPGQTTGQLRAATRRAVLAADPRAARKRKERALQDARVERWDEHAGTAALAGRDLPPASVLAADQNLSALARQLQGAGAPGTLDQLRAQVYLALLSGAPVGALIPAGPGDPGDPGDPGSADTLGLSSVSGAVNLTMPLATWLGLSDSPGNSAGYGPLDADDSRAIADALAARSGTRWCLTLTDSRGHPVAHGCARTGPPPSQRRVPRPAAPPGKPGSGSHDGPAGTPRDGPGSDTSPAAARRDRPGTDSGTSPAGAPRDGPRPGEPSRPRTRAPEGTWTFSLTLLAGESCDHARETAAYRPTPALRHLMEIRYATCTYPGCRRPAMRCDADHTVAYHRGGRTCLCNIAPVCRAHHQAKQAHGWHLRQLQPGVLAWTTPSGRTYSEGPTIYPA